MNKYLNRQHAGRTLSFALMGFANRPEAIVIALPRGGVPVAFEVADTLHLPLDLLIVRKLGVPGHEELALGAIASGGAQFLNEPLIQELDISAQAVNTVIQTETAELQRREQVYRANRPPLNVENKTVILIDDGIATGATMGTAVLALRKLDPREIIVAVPLASQDACQQLEKMADSVICPLQPQKFYAIGMYYEDFEQTTDQEVEDLLSRSNNVYNS